MASHKNQQRHLHVVMRAKVIHDEAASSVVRPSTNLIKNRRKERDHSITSASLPRPHILPSSTIGIPRYSERQIQRVCFAVQTRMLDSFPNVCLADCTTGG